MLLTVSAAKINFRYYESKKCLQQAFQRTKNKQILAQLGAFYSLLDDIFPILKLGEQCNEKQANVIIQLVLCSNKFRRILPGPVLPFFLKLFSFSVYPTKINYKIL